MHAHAVLNHQASWRKVVRCTQNAQTENLYIVELWLYKAYLATSEEVTTSAVNMLTILLSFWTRPQSAGKDRSLN